MPLPLQFGTGPAGAFAVVERRKGISRVARRLRILLARKSAALRTGRRRWPMKPAEQGSILVHAQALLALILLLPSLSAASRAVIVKVDGVPAELVSELANEKDPSTGKSRLPWIDEVFARNGTRIANFYVRGISL